MRRELHLQTRLGTGATGTVWRALTAEGLPVAVKLLRRGDSTRLLREACCQARLPARCALPVHDFGMLRDPDTGQPHPALVMALAEGTLRDAAPIEPTQRRAVILEVLAAVAELHAHGLLHCDLKPSNILRHADRWVLADFGLTRQRANTTADAIGGSLPFMAPEALRGDGRRLTPAADLYAIGCIVWWMLTGRPPFEGSAEAIAACHLSAPRPRVDGPLDAWLAGLLARDPGSRFIDAAAALRACPPQAAWLTAATQDLAPGAATETVDGMPGVDAVDATDALPAPPPRRPLVSTPSAECPAFEALPTSFVPPPPASATSSAARTHWWDAVVQAVAQGTPTCLWSSGDDGEARRWLTAGLSRQGLADVLHLVDPPHTLGGLLRRVLNADDLAAEELTRHLQTLLGDTLPIGQRDALIRQAQPPALQVIGGRLDGRIAQQALSVWLTRERACVVCVARPSAPVLRWIELSQSWSAPLVFVVAGEALPMPEHARPGPALTEAHATPPTLIAAPSALATWAVLDAPLTAAAWASLAPQVPLADLVAAGWIEPARHGWRLRRAARATLVIEGDARVAAHRTAADLAKDPARKGWHALQAQDPRAIPWLTIAASAAFKGGAIKQARVLEAQLAEALDRFECSPGERVNALRVQAEICAMTRRGDRALALLMAARALPTTQADQATVDLLLGYVHRLAGRAAEADAALSAAIATGDSPTRFDARAHRVRLYLRMGRIADALAIAEEMLTELPAATPLWTARARMTRAIALDRAGQPGAARRDFEAARAAFMAEGRPVAAIGITNDLAEIDRAAGRLNQARAAYERCVAFYRDLGSPEWWVPQLNLSLIALATGPTDADRADLEAVRAALAPTGRRYLQLGVAAIEAGFAAQRGDWPAVARALDQADALQAATGARSKDSAGVIAQVLDLAKAGHAETIAAQAAALLDRLGG